MFYSLFIDKMAFLELWEFIYWKCDEYIFYERFFG